MFVQIVKNRFELVGEQFVLFIGLGADEGQNIYDLLRG